MAKHSLPSYFSLQSATEQIARVHSKLLHWYIAEQRDLPWRSTNDPYAILEKKKYQVCSY